jgi:hypothetical protein
MDVKAFTTWDVAKGPPPYDLLKLIEKAEFDSGAIRTYAQQRDAQGQAALILGQLLDGPDAAFVKLAINWGDAPFGDKARGRECRRTVAARHRECAGRVGCPAVLAEQARPVPR